MKNSVPYRVLMLFCSNSLLTLMGFAYRAALSRTASASALGLNSLLSQLYSIIVSVCISGLNVGAAALAARTDESRVRVLTKTALLAFFSLWAAASLPFALFARGLSAALLGEPELKPALLLMLICIFMTGVENMLKSIHMGTGRVKQCAASELCEQGVRFALVIHLLRSLKSSTDPKTVFFIMLGMTLSELVSVSFLGVSYFLSFGTKKEKPHGRLMFRELFSIAVPASLTAIASTVFASIGALALPKLLVSNGMSTGSALSEIGVLNTAAVPLTMLPMALIGAAAAVIMPEISKYASENRDPAKLIRGAFIMTGAAGAAALCLLIPLHQRLSNALFARSVDSTVFVLLMLKALVIYFQVTSTAVLNGLMKQRTVLVFAVIGEAYQLALILLLVPVFGLTGWCAGMILGELSRLLLNLSAIKREVKKGGFYERDMIKSEKPKPFAR